MATNLPDPRLPAGTAGVLRLFLQGMGALLLSLLVALAAAPAQAQIRPIPEKARLATLKLGVFPDALLNGKAVKLGPGARIYNQNNAIIVPSTLKDVSNLVAYVTGSMGEVVSVWILSDAEVKALRARQKKSG